MLVMWVGGLEPGMTHGLSGSRRKAASTPGTVGVRRRHMPRPLATLVLVASLVPLALSTIQSLG